MACTDVVLALQRRRHLDISGSCPPGRNSVGAAGELGEPPALPESMLNKLLSAVNRAGDNSGISTTAKATVVGIGG